jgi:hypothetical protein
VLAAHLAPRDPAAVRSARMDALIGAVVGAVLTAVLGAWRDHQQRQHHSRAELRTQRFAAVADLTAAVNELWSRRTDVVFAVDESRDAHMEDRDEDAARAMEKATSAGVTFRSAEQEAAVALSRVRLVCPALKEEAEALVKACRDYDPSWANLVCSGPVLDRLEDLVGIGR